MRLFKKRNRKEANAQTGKDKLAKGIVSFILKMQNGFAKFMNKRTEKLSSSTMKFSVIIFLLTGSSLSIYFIVTAFKKNGQSKALKIDRLSTPRYFDRNGDEPVQPVFFISEQEHTKMKSFENYMDSLHHSKIGTRIYDSIMLDRPGLMDSVKKLERIYQQQLQNKK